MSSTLLGKIVSKCASYTLLKIGASTGHFVQCSGRGQQGRSTFAEPNAQRDYAKHFNAVDRNDRDLADYTASLRTNRWYLRVFFWLLDRVVHQLYVTLIYCVRNGIGPAALMEYMWQEEVSD
jgi:hypothetical protein